MTSLTVLAGLEGLFGEVVMSLAGGGDDYELDFGIGEDSVKRVVDDNSLGSLLSEAGLKLATRGSWFAFHDCMEGEEVGKGEDEWNVEGKASEADTYYTGLDGGHCNRCE